MTDPGAGTPVDAGRRSDRVAEDADDRVRRIPPPSLLVTLLGDPLDPGYAEAGRRHAGDRARPGARRRAVGYVVVGALLAGGVFGVAVVVNEANAPRDASARQAIVTDIRAAQEAAVELEASATMLADEVRRSNEAIGHAADEDLEVAGGAVAVTGPGLRVIVDAPAVEDGGTVILDRDIQLLVNGLWAAGAEAVAVGGVRLRPTSTIRKAGEAILVDNKPVFWPLELVAVGSPTTMAADFAGTSGFGRFSSFVSLYDVTFEVEQVEDLSLPAAPAPVLRYARAPQTTAPHTIPDTTAPDRTGLSSLPTG